MHRPGLASRPRRAGREAVDGPALEDGAVVGEAGGVEGRAVGAEQHGERRVEMGAGGRAGAASPGARPTRAGAGSARCPRSSVPAAPGRRASRRPGSRPRAAPARRATPPRAARARGSARRRWRGSRARRWARRGSRGRACSAALRGARAARSRASPPPRCRPSQSWPATNPPVQGSPVSASSSVASGESRRQRPSSVKCGSRPSLGVQAGPGRRRARAPQPAHARPRASAPPGRRCAPALRERPPPAVARQSSPWTRTWPYGWHSSATSTSWPNRVSAPTCARAAASTRARRPSARSRWCGARRRGRAPACRARRRATTRTIATTRITCRRVRRRTRSSPILRVRPSASKRSSRSCAVRRPTPSRSRNRASVILPAVRALLDERRAGGLVGGAGDRPAVADAGRACRPARAAGRVSASSTLTGLGAAASSSARSSSPPAACAFAPGR